MSCLKPTQAWQDLGSLTKSGKHPIIFSYKDLDPADYFWHENEEGDVEFVSTRYRSFNAPCGKCILCRKTRAWEITVRALLELQADPFQKCCFITLTCDDDRLPAVFPGKFLSHRPWQLFAKRLRKEKGPFRYLMCGEYGEHTKRPHYHAIIYGLDLTDRKFDSKTCTYCDSPDLRRIWSHGNIMCRSVNSNAIAYVAGYQLKFDGVDIDVDDIVDDGYDSDIRLNNYVRWSRRPGLGLPFLLKYPEMFRQCEFTCDDGFKVPSIAPSIVHNGKLSYFDGRYFKNYIEKSSDCNLRQKYDIMSAFNESRLLKELLHGLPYAARVRAHSLENRAELYEVQLAKKQRDLVVA